MAAGSKSDENPGMALVVTFLALFVVNALVLWLANSLFPYYVVLGTITITHFWAILLSMGVLALVDTFAIPFVREFEKNRGKMFTSKEWLASYFLLNLVAVWFIARFPSQFGLGLRSWPVALLLAVAFDLLQGVAMMQLPKLRAKLGL